MTIVIDASVVVAALLDGGDRGTWARAALRDRDVAVPSHFHVEVSNVIRRAVLAGRVGRDEAKMAHGDLVHLTVAVFPFEPLGDRVWELHTTVTAYDAVYVALAEVLDAPLWTLDRRLAAAPGPRCAFRTPA